MRRPKTLIALGLLPVALLGGLALHGPEVPGPGAWLVVARPAAPEVSAGDGPRAPVRRVALDDVRLGGPCGPTSDELRCRSGD